MCFGRARNLWTRIGSYYLGRDKRYKRPAVFRAGATGSSCLFASSLIVTVDRWTNCTIRTGLIACTLYLGTRGRSFDESNVFLLSQCSALLTNQSIHFLGSFIFLFKLEFKLNNLLMKYSRTITTDKLNHLQVEFDVN